MRFLVLAKVGSVIVKNVSTKVIICILVIVFCGCAAKQHMDTYWYSKTFDDLKFIKNTLAIHSAPAANLQDYKFNKWLVEGFKQASHYAKKVKNSDNYYDVLQFYIRGFKLDHLSIRFTNMLGNIKRNWSYPGFLLKLLGDQYVVGYVDSKVFSSFPLKEGMKIIEIDGKPIDFYMKNVFAALYGTKYTKAEYSRLAPFLLVDKNNFLFDIPKEITFVESGKHKKLKLVWYSKDVDELWSIADNLGFGETPSIGFKLINNGVWVNLPTFDPSDKEKKTFIEILKNLKKFRDYPFIIFDVRGNGGGDTSWQRPVLRNLYGDSFIKSLGRKHHYNYDWVKKIRVTPENYNNLQKHMAESKKKSFLDDLKHNRMHHIEKWNIFDEKENLFSHQDVVKTFPKTYLLTDGRCSSTCWLFVREMLQMPNVVQIGEETNTQSLYSQSRSVDLPSGLGKFVFPMQERVFPVDYINQPFIPHLKYFDNWHDIDG